MEWVKGKMQEARLNRLQVRDHDTAKVSAHPVDEHTLSGCVRSGQTYNRRHKIVWLATGFISGVTIVLSAWWTGSTGVGIVDIPQLQNRISAGTQLSLKPQRGPDGGASGPGQGSDETVADIASGFETLPPPAAGNATPLATMESDSPGAVTAAEFQSTSIQPPADTQVQPAEPAKNKGSWAINLASLRRQVDAEQFVKGANAKGVAAEVIQSIVEGKAYWRVQVTGFSTPEEARARAGEVQNRLGLKDVWIVRSL